MCNWPLGNDAAVSVPAKDMEQQDPGLSGPMFGLRPSQQDGPWGAVLLLMLHLMSGTEGKEEVGTA